MKPVIIGIGELLWDMLPTGKEMGGAPANFCYHAQALGGQSKVISAVSSDDFGQQLLKQLDKIGLSREHVAIDREHPTGRSDVQIDAAGKPIYIIRENVAWDYIRPTPQTKGLARHADAVYFGTLGQRAAVSRETTLQLVESTPTKALRIFDINLRQSFYSREIIERSLALANVLKITDEELVVLADLLSLTGDESSLLPRIADRYKLRLIALTKGPNGSTLYAEGRAVAHPGFPVQVVDTVGAGDSFTATVTMGLLRGHSLEAISDHANRVASFVCSKPGATPELPEDLRTGFD